MIHELYEIQSRETALRVQDGQIDSVRKKHVTQSGCRVYDRGAIGIAGTLGPAAEETWRKAEEALRLQVAYPYAPASGPVRARELGELPSQEVFLSRTEEILRALREEFPRFVLSNQVLARETRRTVKNDLGLCLEDVQRELACVLIAKDRDSANVFDTAVTWQGRELEEEEILRRGREILGAHLEPADLPRENVPVLLEAGQLSAMLGTLLDIQRLKRGASLLSGRENTQLFSPLFSLDASREAATHLPFFDAEGTTLEGDRLALIEGGVLRRGLADRKGAAEYGCDLTASAGGSYDDVPTLGASPDSLPVRPTGTLRDILGQGEAVLIAMAAGGDITPAGDYATPVQAAYLCREGRLVGRLPELNFRANLFELLGKNYLGCTSDAPWSADRLLVTSGTLSL